MQNLTNNDKNEIIQLIYTEYGTRKLRPTALTRVDECRFFPCHNNSFDGYFIDVQYADGIYEIWFVVLLGGCPCDAIWHLEKIR